MSPDATSCPPRRRRARAGRSSPTGRSPTSRAVAKGPSSGTRRARPGRAPAVRHGGRGRLPDHQRRQESTRCVRTHRVVLLHGFWHESWCWSLVVEELAAQGIGAVAVDLEGHGLRGRSPRSRWARPFDPAAYATEPSPPTSVTASSAASTLIDQLRRIGQGQLCVLVAHSMAGVVATAAAERAPQLVAHLVCVSAFVPVSGRSATDYIVMPEMGDQIQTQLCADPMLVGALRYDTGDPAIRDPIHRTFYTTSTARQQTAPSRCSPATPPLGSPRSL